MNHYQILQVSQQATQTQIKQAYRRLAKQFHPDSNQNSRDCRKIVELNAAYEVLGDPQSRRSYDRSLAAPIFTREQRTARAQERYQRDRHERAADYYQLEWIQSAYVPTIELIKAIIQPLRAEIDELSADPFDDELMEGFQIYLERCRDRYRTAQQIFASVPNPPHLAGVAANLYYCLNQIDDGIRELEWFSLNYDYSYLHSGQEIFRIAEQLLIEACEYMNAGSWL